MRQFVRQSCIILILILSLAGSVARAMSKPIVELASWYGRAHHGKKMANGRLFDRFRLTAAHRTIKLGTLVRVCLLKTGKCVDVLVTDRGPFKGRRGLDVSEAAAEAIGLKPYGVGRVTIEELHDQSR